MKKFILTVLFIAVLLVGTFAYLLVRSLNAQSYQQQIISAVADLTGKEMTVASTPSLKWWPMPTLVMNGITISNHNGSEKQNMLTADSLQVQIEWASLFETPLVVKNVELIKPVLHLERLENNQANWDLPLFSAPDSDINDALFLGTQNTSSTMKIEKLHIQNGTVVYDNKITGQNATFEALNGDIAVSSLKGPYQFDGTAKIFGTTFAGKINSEVIRNDMASKITAQITEKNSGLQLDFNGEFSPSDPKKVVWGDASFAIAQPQPLMEAFGFPILNDILKQSVVGSFAINITPLEDKLNNLIVRFGTDENPFAVTTTLTYAPKTAVSPESYTGQIAINKLDYAAFKPYFDKFGWTDLTNTETVLPNVQSTLNISELVLPTGTLKNTSADVLFANHQLSLTGGKTTLLETSPITFRINGGQKDKKPYLVSHVSGTTTNAEALFKLLNIQTSTAPTQDGQATTPSIEKIIKNIETDAQITWTPETLSVQFNKLTVDAVNATGSVDVALNNAKNLTVNLDVNNLNLDTYTGWTEPKDKTNLSDLPNLFRKTAENANGLKEWNATFNTTFNALTWHKLPITKGVLNGTLQNGTLTINQAEFNGVATASLKTNGAISGLGTNTATIDSLSFSFSAGQLPLFLERAGLTSNLPLFKNASETKIAGSITNDDNMWKSNVMLTLNDASVKLNGSMAFVENNTNFKDFNINITHPNFHKFLSLINIDPKPVDKLNGALRAQGTLNGTLKDLSLTGADVSVGIQKIAGSLTYTDNGTKKLVINATSPALEGERLIPQMALTNTDGTFSKKTFDFSKWDNWDIAVQLSIGRLSYKVLDLMDAKLGFTLKDKVLTLSQFSGIQRGNSNAKFNTSGQLSYINTPTLKADVELADLTVRPDFMIINKFSYGDGTMGLKGTFNTTGSSVMDMIDNLNGNGHILFANGQFIGLDLAKVEPLVRFATTKNMSQKDFDAQMNRLTKLGKTPVDSLSGGFSISKGIARCMDMTLKTPAGIATPTQIVWNIPTSALNMSAPIQINGLNNYPPIILTIDTNRAKKTYNVDYTDLSNVISGQVQQVIDAQVQAKQQAELMAQQQEQQKQEQERQNQIEALNKLVEQAQTTVPQMAKELQDVSDDKTKALIQNALDALSIVNQLALKENKTSEQTAMLAEQAKLALIKINEAQKAAAEAPVNYTQTVAKMEKAASQMVGKMSALQRSLPHIVIIPKLTEQATQNLNILQSAKTRLGTASQNEQTTILTEATNAYKAIESAYSNVMRFDTSGVVYTPVSPSATSGVRGTISK